VYDADALTEILHEILNANRENKGMVKLCYLSEHIRKKFKEIRDVF
jgi:23S rRNA maturation-related 3'-5' exoribonuclease YhaM